MHGVPKTVVFSEFSVFVKSQSQVFDSANWIAAVQGDPPLRVVHIRPENPQSTSDFLAGSWCNELSCAIQNLVCASFILLADASRRSNDHGSFLAEPAALLVDIFQVMADLFGHMCGSGFRQTVIHFSGRMECCFSQAQCEQRIVALAQGSCLCDC